MSLLYRSESLILAIAKSHPSSTFSFEVSHLSLTVAAKEAKLSYEMWCHKELAANDRALHIDKVISSLGIGQAAFSQGIITLLWTSWAQAKICVAAAQNLVHPLGATQKLGQVFAVVVKTLLGTHIPPWFSWVQIPSHSTFQSSRWWFKYVGPCHTHGRSGLSSRFQALTCPSCGCCHIPQYMCYINVLLFLPSLLRDYYAKHTKQCCVYFITSFCPILPHWWYFCPNFPQLYIGLKCIISYSSL